MVDFYSTGTIAVTNGSPTVTGTGTIWLPTNIKAGDVLFVAGAVYPVIDVDVDQVHLTLGLNYAGTTASGLSYKVAKTSSDWGTNRTLSTQTAALIEAYAAGALTLEQLTDAVDAAETAQAAAETALDQFTDQWLGLKAADPSTDNDGDALANGMLYLNSVSNLVRIRIAGAWANLSAGVQGVQGISAGILQTYMTGTAATEPGTGNFKLNNGTHASATAAYLDNLDTPGSDVSGRIDTFDDPAATIRGRLLIVSLANQGIWRLYTFGGSVSDSTGFRTLSSLAYVAGAGTLSNNTPCSLIYFYGGEAGPTGVTGATGAAGSDGFTLGIRFEFDTPTTDADPGAGKWRANNGTWSSTTILYISKTDADGNDQSEWLEALDDVSNVVSRNRVTARDVDDVDPPLKFDVTGTITDATTYVKVPVSTLSGTTPTDATVLAFLDSVSGRDGGGDMTSSNNLSDLTDKPAAITNLGLSAFIHKYYGVM